MKRLLPLAAVAALSSLVTAAAIAIPALADDDPQEPRLGERVDAGQPGDRFDSGPLADRFARFADCMRENGFDLTGDAQVRITPDGVTLNGEAVDAEAFKRAARECRPPWRGLGRGAPGMGELPDREELREQRDAFLSDVARRLGVTTVELREALRGAAVARIDSLEQSGAIEPEQADALRELVRSGALPFLGGPLLHGPRMFGRPFEERGEDTRAPGVPDLPDAA